MAKDLKLGVYLHNTHFGNKQVTVTNSEIITFIERAGIGDQLTLSASVLYKPDIIPENYYVVVEKRDISVLPLPGWKDMPTSLLRLPFCLRSILRNARSLVRQSDLIWIRIPSAVAFFFWWLARKNRKPLIIHVAGNILLTPRPPKYKGLRLFAARILSRVLHLLTRWMIHYGIILVAGGELQKLLSTPLHPAYLFDDTLISQKDLKPAKKTMGQAKEILFVGRFDYGKGIEILIEVMALLSNEFPDIKLKMAGDGVLFETIRRKVEERKLKKHVKLLGFVPSTGPLQGLYKKADILVLPSDTYPEGFPRVILEAWAAGIPLVTTRLAGIPYRVRDEQNGLMVTPGDRNELANALRRLITNEKLRYRIAEGGCQTVRRLTFEHQVYLIKGLLRSYYPNLSTTPNTGSKG